jgi:soluble lytic murein transglycosylase-like protein
MNAHELNKWGQAVELNGGKAEDAQSAFAKITQEFSQQQVTGATGPLLTFLRARGVSIRDANGNLRNQGDILEDLADKTAQYGRVYQATMFRNAGLSEGEINYLTMEKKARVELQQLAERNNAITEASTKEAAELQKQWNAVLQTEKGAFQSFLTEISPGLISAWEKTIDVTSRAMSGIDDWFKGIEAKKQKAKNAPAGPGAFDRPAAPAGGYWNQFTTGVANAFKEANRAYAQTPDPVQRADLLAKIAATEAALGIPTGLLARIAQQESHFRPDIISGQTRSKAGAVGLMQLMPNVFKGAASMTSEQQIAVAGAEIKRLHEVFGDWATAVAAYNDGQGNIRKVLAGKKTLPVETSAYLSHVLDGPTPNAGGAGSSHSTDVDVGSINIYPGPGANPAAIAMMVPAAIERKMSVSQAAVGQS